MEELDPNLNGNALVQENDLDLKLNVTNSTTQNIISQISAKIEFLKALQTQNEHQYDKQLNELTVKDQSLDIQHIFSEQTDILTLIKTGMDKELGVVKELQQQAERLRILSIASKRRKRITDLREDAQKLQIFLSDYEKFIQAYEDHDFLKLFVYKQKLEHFFSVYSNLQNFISKHMKQIESFTSAHSLNQLLKDSISCLLDKQYSILSFFKFLWASSQIFLESFIDRFSKNKDFSSMSNMHSIQEILNTFGFRFDIISGLVQLSKETLFTASSTQPNETEKWEVPTNLLNKFRESQIINVIITSFESFVEKMDPLKLINQLSQQWKNIESLIDLSINFDRPEPNLSIIHHISNKFNEIALDNTSNYSNFIEKCLEIAKFESEYVINGRPLNISFVVQLIESTSFAFGSSLIHSWYPEVFCNLDIQIDREINTTPILTVLGSIQKSESPVNVSKLNFRTLPALLFDTFKLLENNDAVISNDLTQKEKFQVFKYFLSKFPLFVIPYIFSKTLVIACLCKPESKGKDTMINIRKLFKQFEDKTGVTSDSIKHIAVFYCRRIYDEEKLRDTDIKNVDDLFSFY